ncbi:HK97 gp10 family phage protein [Fusobacterium sp. IOR10]|uniref:HK97 gp10 family phage protein n=1 Tax=Fusobacterium sp. IOR10 TaxID=2665157 RepID=UPI0013D3D8E3|nr:HK97 gp10 family phage protein [Fusobacterium sp. IOR10]
MIDDFEKVRQELLSIAKEIGGGKKTKSFLKKAGKGLKDETIKMANTRVKKYTGNYIKSIKAGKVFETTEGDLAVRTYSYSPHAHLIEYGHNIVNKAGEKVDHKDGYKVFSKASKNYEKKFTEEIDKFLDELIEE